MLTSGDSTAQNPTSLHVPDVSGMDTLTAALAYAAAGWFIAPTDPHHENVRERKNPGMVLGRGWDEKTSRDPKQIAGWYAGTDYGIALHAGRSGAVIFDVDEPVPGPELTALLAELDATGAPYQRTDKAGRRLHYVVRQPAGFAAGNGAKNVGVRKVDVRGKNGVIVVYPTPRPGEDDREYMWLRTGAVPAPGPALTARMAPAVAAATRLDGATRTQFMDALARGPMCSRVLAICGTANWTGGRYEEAMRLTLSLLHAGREGHVGVNEAVDLLASVYREQIGTERRDPTEWQRQLAGAVDQAAEHGPIVPVDPCNPPAAFAPPVNAEWLVPTRPLPAVAPPAAHVAVPERTDTIGDLLKLPPDEALHAARLLVAQLVDVSPMEEQEWRTQLKTLVKLPAGDFNAILRATRKERKAQEEAWGAAARAERAAQAEAENRLMAGPHDPLRAARDLVKRIPHSPDGEGPPVPHVRWWRGDFYAWQQTAWKEWRQDSVDHWLYQQTEHAEYLNEDGDTEGWKPSERRISGVAHALGRGVLYRDGHEESEDGPDAIACANGVLVGGLLRPHHPRHFNLYALPFSYDAAATCPQWLAFLEQVLPGDHEAHLFLQQWFGYVLSGRTDLQKMASLFGPPRCGKGTIARVLEALLGSESVASPSLEKLATQFGEAPLIGKRLAILSDVRWNARATAEAVPVMLAISGEDARNVPRKNRDDWHGKLDVRFMAMGNDAPAFNDASGAMAGRMIHIEFRKTFAGNEDPTLTPRLLGELAGILNWALAGLHSLTEAGRFTSPSSSQEANDAVMRISSPVRAFMEDRCLESPAAVASLDDVYDEYRRWCESEGRERSFTKEIFSKELRSAGSGHIAVERRRNPITGLRERRVIGLQLSASVAQLSRLRPGSVPGSVPA